MKKQVQFYALAACAAVLSLIACSTEDSPAPLTSSDLNTTITENPESGDVLGQVASSAAAGEAIFSVQSSDPSGAISIDPTTGEVSVSDASAFDFETRTSVSASIRIVSGEQESFSSVFVTITDADDILTLLTTSRQAYADETNGWVQITEEEYNLLEQRMAEVTKIGVPEFDYGPKVGDFATNFTFSNSTNITMPAGSYFFAFRYTAGQNVPEAQVRPKVSQSGPITGFVGQGPLPPHLEGDVFFVRKGQYSATTSSQAYLALYTPYASGYVENTSNTLYYRSGNGSDLPNTLTPYQALQQGLTTTLKQWD